MGNDIDYGTTYEERVQIAENRCRELEAEVVRLSKLLDRANEEIKKLGVDKHTLSRSTQYARNDLEWIRGDRDVWRKKCSKAEAENERLRAENLRLRKDILPHASHIDRERRLRAENERLRKVVEITKDLIACTANCQDCTASGSGNCERFVAARSIATISGLKKDGDK